MRIQEKHEREKSEQNILRQIQELQGLQGRLHEFQVLEQEITRLQSTHKVHADVVADVCLRVQRLDARPADVKERQTKKCALDSLNVEEVLESERKHINLMKEA